MTRLLLRHVRTRTPVRRRALPFALLMGALVAACHNGTDFADTARPSPAGRSVLELRTSAMRGDTLDLTLTLGAGANTSLGSLTGEIQGGRDWTFVRCEAAQGAPLLACKQHTDAVKVAAAWVAGTNAGALVTLTFVRGGATSGATNTNAPIDWTLTVQEAHSVAGKALTDSLDVRREAVR